MMRAAIGLWAIGVALTVTAHPARAESWVFIGNTHEQNWYVNMRSIGNYDGYRKIWARRDNFQARTATDEDGTTYIIWSQIDLWIVDCDQWAAALVEWLLYDGQSGTGNMIYRGRRPFDPDELREAPPETVIEEIVSRACQ